LRIGGGGMPGASAEKPAVVRDYSGGWALVLQTFAQPCDRNLRPGDRRPIRLPQRWIVLQKRDALDRFPAGDDRAWHRGCDTSG